MRETDCAITGFVSLSHVIPVASKIWNRSLCAMAQLTASCLKFSLFSAQFSFHLSISRSLVSYNVVFYGSDKFSLPSLLKLNSLRSTGLVSALKVVSKSNSLVANTAGKIGLPFGPWPPDFTEHSHDVGFVVSFGHLLPQDAISQCKYGIINVHASLLPRWRGASPIHHAILAGDQVTGVTVMKIDADKFDTGDILTCHEYKMPHRTVFSSLYNDLSHLASEALEETLCDLENALANRQPQPSTGITRASKPRPSDPQIDFHLLTSIEVDRRMRAFDGLMTCFTDWIDGSRLRLLSIEDPSVSETAEIDKILEPEFGIPEIASIFYHPYRKQLFFKCADHKWVSFSFVAPAGKKVFSALDFYNGYISKLITSEDNHRVKIPRNRIYPPSR